MSVNENSHASYLASELALKKDVQVDVLTSAIGTKPIKIAIPRRNLIIHRVDFGHTESLHYEGAIKRGLQLCEGIEPDIIQGQHIAGALIGLHLKASFGMPLEVTLHKTPKSNWDETITRRAPIYSYLKLLSKYFSIDAELEDDLIKSGISGN